MKKRVLQVLTGFLLMMSLCVFMRTHLCFYMTTDCKSENLTKHTFYRR